MLEVKDKSGCAEGKEPGCMETKLIGKFFLLKDPVIYYHKKGQIVMNDVYKYEVNEINHSEDTRIT